MGSKTSKINPIVLFGGSGLLGKELISALESHRCTVVAPSHEEIDITDLKALTCFFKGVKPAAVINAAALIDVDKAEEHPSVAEDINAMGAGNIAQALALSSLRTTRLVHISTNYVFGNSKSARDEKDAPKPVNVYGKTKMRGENLVARIARKESIPYYIIRTSWLYSQFRGTFVDAVARTLLKRKSFQASKEYFGNPTSAADLARAVIKEFLFKKKRSGIFHLINRDISPRGGVTRYDIALKIANILGTPPQLIENASGDMFRVRRPKTAILANTKSPPLPPWEKSLKTYILMKYKK